MLVSRQFGNEVVLANYQTGIYYSLTGTGADIWLGLKAGTPVDEIAAAFSSNCSVARDAVDPVIRTFVDRLLAEGIIAPFDSIPERRDWSPASAGFAEPVLERYDDLRDLLLLDPVHDVSESGWPLRKSDAG